MSSMVSNGPRCVRNSNGGRTIVKVKMGVASTIKLEQMERSGEGFFFSVTTDVYLLWRFFYVVSRVNIMCFVFLSKEVIKV